MVASAGLASIAGVIAGAVSIAGVMAGAVSMAGVIVAAGVMVGGGGRGVDRRVRRSRRDRVTRGSADVGFLFARG